MPFKDMIPWRRGRQELPVRRAEAARSDELVPNGELGLAPLFHATESLFDRFFQGFGGSLLAPDFFSGGSAFGPAANLDFHESDEAFFVTVELPGVDEKDVEVSLSKGALTIRGEKRSEERREKGEAFRTERSYGRFERTVALPAEIDEDRVQASFRRGVLEVTLPKSRAAREQARRIAVRTDD